jgi:hypothetical protein
MRSLRERARVGAWSLWEMMAGGRFIFYKSFDFMSIIN